MNRVIKIHRPPPRGTLLSLPSLPSLPSTENKARQQFLASYYRSISAVSRLPLDYTYTSLKILKLSRATRSAFIENRLEPPGVRRVLHPFQCQAKKGEEGGGMCRSRSKRKKETKTKRKPSFSSPLDFSARLSILREKPYSFDHPILPSFPPLPYYHIGYGEKQDSTRERKEK